MLVTADSHRLPHEHALAVLLEGRTPITRVHRLASSSSTHWQEHPEFGKGRGGRGQGQGQSGQQGRRLRQYSARVGQELITISSDADERRDEAFTPRINTLLCGLDEAYRI